MEARVIFNGLVMMTVFLAAAILLAIIHIDNPSWLHSFATFADIFLTLISTLIIFLPTFLTRKKAVQIERQTANTGQTKQIDFLCTRLLILSR